MHRHPSPPIRLGRRSGQINLPSFSIKQATMQSCSALAEPNDNHSIDLCKVNPLDYNAMKESARRVANNEALSQWATHSEHFTKEDHDRLMPNMKKWLAPTITRLKSGLNLIKDRSELSDITHAFEHNIADESGEGVPERAHAKLFSDSISRFSKDIYCQPFNTTESGPATAKLAKQSMDLFKGDRFVMLGACLAQELHALPQLENMYTGIKNSYNKNCISMPSEVSEFYDIHLDGTEARHAEDLQKTVLDLLDSHEKIDHFEKGFNEMLTYLNEFWAERSKDISDSRA